MHQQELAACISDSFYRELFMSPCLSGWSDGEEKSVYMHLCHQVMTRSQLSAIVKLREAGIVANDLIVLPNLSNVSLANNGMHVSIGSRRLSEALGEHGGFSPGEEKRLGDLAVKIYEHFLVLFVGIFSAAPYRVAFDDFHPERLLSFLPHELDFTHLRLMWREWKEKASLRAFGHSLTPYGPRCWTARSPISFACAAIAFPTRACSPTRSHGWPPSTHRRWMAVPATFIGCRRNSTSLASLTGRCRFTCRCGCASTGGTAMPASKPATTACFRRMATTWQPP